MMKNFKPVLVILATLISFTAYSFDNGVEHEQRYEVQQDRQIAKLLSGARDFFETHEYDALIVAATELSMDKTNISQILDSVMTGMDEQQKARFVAAVERKFYSLQATVSLNTSKEVRELAIMGLAIVGVLDGIEQLN